MRHLRCVPPIVCVLMISISGCEEHQHASSVGANRRVLDSLVSMHPCTSRSISIKGASSLSRNQRCALVDVGFIAVASGLSTPTGVMSFDTTRIRGATITRFAFRDTSERASTTYWSVDFDTGDPAWTPTVHIDALTGKVTAGLAPNP